MNKLILDTSVFIKMRHKKCVNVIESLLNRYTTFEVFVSDMTFFELIRQCNNIVEIQKTREILNQYGRYSVDTDMIAYATYYVNVLSKHKKSDGKFSIQSKQLSDSDAIIGATAMRGNSFLCTTDSTDFPQPFFSEISSDLLFPESTDKIFIFKPDTSLYDRSLRKFIKIG